VYYVEVRADGTPEHPYGVLKVAHPATGVYCLTGHRFRWVDVTSKSVDEAQRAAVLAYAEGQAPEAPCDSGTTARVTIDAPGSPGLDDGPFLFVGSRDADAS
jgi:hypothetical protein